MIASHAHLVAIAMAMVSRNHQALVAKGKCRYTLISLLVTLGLLFFKYASFLL